MALRGIDVAPPNGRARQAGFTLLEVLVAFIIAALALGVLFDGVLAGMRAASVANHTQRAVTLARARLASVGVAVANGAAATVAEQDGDEGGGFHYAVRVRPAARVAMPRDPDAVAAGTGGAAKATLFAISVTVGWKGDGGNRQVRLDGARLALTPG